MEKLEWWVYQLFKKKVREYFNRFDTLPYMVNKDIYYTKVETDKRTDTAQWHRPR